MASEFHLRGHVPPDSPAYVDRSFVDECFAELSSGRWVVLLGPRQHGKTSGLLRLAERLREAGVATALVSLQGIPQVSSYSDLLSWIARRIAEQFDVDLVPPSGEDASELDAWFARAVPEAPTPIAVLLDEAAGVQDDGMRSDLYRQLRRLHDERDMPAHPNLGRSFALLFSGTFEPRRLVADDLTSPFNVCQQLESKDLTLEDAYTLVRQLDADEAEPYVERAFRLVGGQPMLLQELLSAVQGSGVDLSADECYDAAEQKLLVGDSDHLSDLISAVVSDPPVRAVAERVVQSDSGVPFVADSEHRMLVTLGLARIDGGRLVSRNDLYQKVAARHPLLSTAGGPSPVGTHVAPFGAGTFGFVADTYLQTFAEEMAEAAYTALNDGHLRLGLIGLGSALEAVLIDTLEQAGQSDRDAARSRANPRLRGQENPTVPNTWRLVNLVKVVAELPRFSNSSIQAVDVLRDLRNLVHPSVGRADGLPQADLQGEVLVAQGLLAVVIREFS